MKKKKVAIIGCGAIFNRHLSAIEKNRDLYDLVAVCDNQKEISKSYGEKHGAESFFSLDSCLEKSAADFYVIATPNYLHYEQAKKCILKSKEVLIEKPATLRKEELVELINLAEANNVNAYCILQVRLNNSVSVVKKCLEKNLLGKVRSASLVQRWQRPVEYFSGWRAISKMGGGTLHEVGIHYIDILQYLLGRPKIVSSKTFNTKHKTTEIEDTVYSILDFGDYGGTLEITISAEPHNLECSLSIMGSNGFLKLGGKALNIVESYNFLSHGAKKKFEHIMQEYENVTYISPNDYGSYLGSCPNHGDLYGNLEKFNLKEAIDSLTVIEDIYSSCGRRY
tara:strand:- start:2021 stop:3034 length:1014 start_codon:yes stop_codon:yes gene_type:complete